MTKRVSIVSAAVAVGLALASISMPQAAGLQSKMDSVFGEMSNISRPGVFETQRRGVLSGGSMYVRSPIMNTDLINFQAPSFKAGCGGVDFFGGSFSFVNADQFVQLLRTVAANSKGYAFQIALNIACPDCSAWINSLQSKIQQLNEALGNSCQLAQGLVNDVASAFGAKRQNEYTAVGTITGIFDDWFGSKNNPDGTDTAKQVDEKGGEKTKRIVGNIVWDALKKGNVKSWIVDAGDEVTEYGILMAVTGTIVIPKSTDDTANPDTGNTNNPRYYPDLITYKELLNGGNLQVYKCNDNDCLEPAKETVKVTGMVQRVREAFKGDGTSEGVLRKFGMMSGNAFTQKEGNLMSNMPQAIGAIVRQLATASNDVALDQADDLAYAVAMSWANEMIQEQLKAVRHALSNSDKPESKQMLDTLNETEERLYSAYQVFAADHPTISKIIDQYNAVQKNIYKITVAATGSTVAATNTGE